VPETLKASAVLDVTTCARAPPQPHVAGIQSNVSSIQPNVAGVQVIDISMPWYPWHTSLSLECNRQTEPRAHVYTAVPPLQHTVPHRQRTGTAVALSLCVSCYLELMTEPEQFLKLDCVYLQSHQLGIQVSYHLVVPNRTW
jgi:hypothetical protein